MGMLDRLRRDEARPTGGDVGPADGEQQVVVDSGPVDDPVPSDEVAARAAQLIDLDDALRRLARAMAAETDRMRNPGWAGKVADYRSIAADAARLERDGFQRADLTDLASQVVPLWSAGTRELAPEYAAMAGEHEAVLAAVAVLRRPLQAG